MEKEKFTYTFTAYGHPNVKATHFKTLEITKDTDLTERGDCIVAINADFDPEELKKFTKKAKLIISVTDENGAEYKDEFKFSVNKNFNSDHEIVLRKSQFNSNRTFGFFLNKGASRLDRKIVELLQNSETKVQITVQSGWGE